MRTVQLFTALLSLLHSNSAYNLHYDSTNHYYDDLLISISPDVPGNHILAIVGIGTNIILFLISETDSSKTINNIKFWLKEVKTEDTLI